MTNKLVVIISSLKYQKLRKFYYVWNEISCTKMQLPPELLTRGILPPDPHSLCPLSSAEFVEPPPPHRKKFLCRPLFWWITYWPVTNFACAKSLGQNLREFIITLSFIVNLQKVCNIYYVHMCKVCLHGERHKSGSNDLLVTAVLAGSKGDFPMAATLSLYILRIYYLQNVVYLLKSITINYFRI
jgi:hypothetical protein